MKFFNEISISMSGTSRKTAVMALSDLKLADIEWRTKNKKKGAFPKALLSSVSVEFLSCFFLLERVEKQEWSVSIKLFYIRKCFVH